MVARITIREQSSDDTTINASAGNGASPAVDTIEDSTTSKNNSSDYYSRGSKEVAVETALTLERLEAVRVLYMSVPLLSSQSNGCLSLI